jgi:N-methylhydantoinase A
VTDANVVLGYLNPRALVGGALEIDAGRAEQAIHDAIVVPLGLDLVRAAWGIHALANSNMIRAIRAVTVERGRDPRGLGLVAFGGSGPVHGAAIAAAMGMRTVIVPRFAGLLSAVGLLASRVEHHYSRVWMRPLAGTGAAEIGEGLEPIVAEARAALISDGHGADQVELNVDLHYAGQSSSLGIPFDPSADDPVSKLSEDFRTEYQRTYGHLLHDEPIEVMTLRAIARGSAPEQPLYGTTAPEASSSVSPGRSRRAFFGPDAGWLETPVLPRSALNTRIDGPVLIEEYDTTIVVPPRWSAGLSGDGDILMEASP